MIRPPRESRFLVRQFAFAAAVAIATLSLGACDGTPRPPNVVLIVVDTLRADALGCYGAERNPTPAIDRLAQAGTRFQVCRAHSSWTLPSTGTILTGRYPSEHGATGLTAAIAPGVPLLTEHFRERGYRTAAVVTHDLVGSPYGFDRGFDLFDEELASRHHQEHTSEDVTGRALTWLKAEPDPFFLFLHYFDPHFNYLQHDGLTQLGEYDGPLRPGMDIGEIRREASRLGPADHRFLRELYDGEVRFLDRSLARLLDGLDQLGLDDNTIVVLTGDHGEEFFEHGWIGHTRSLHREVVSVPLIIRGPAVPVASRPDAAWLLDVYPSVLALAGLEPWPAGGRDLFDGERAARAVFAEVSYDPWTPENLELARQQGREPSPDDRVLARSVRKGRWKAIQDVAADRWQLFDLAKDPGEKNDVAAQSPEALQGLADEMKAWRQSLVLPESSAAAAPSEERLERLRALGYVQ